MCSKPEGQLETVKKHFEDEAKEFDQIISQLIPHYSEMVNALVSVLPFEKSSAINVIDLGCGTGTISKQIKEEYPHATITCLDLAKNMIEMSQLKLAGFSGVQYEIGNFNSYEFKETYDVVVSSLALHHLVTSEEKKVFYKKIYESLRANGVFFNADVILGSNDSLQKAYMKKWKAFMKKSVSEEEIENKWLPKYREEDRPARLMDHLNWLNEVGFAEVDVVWKYYNFSVYGGKKCQ